MNDRLQKAYLSVTRLDFNKCQQLLNQEKKTNSKNAAVYYVESFHDFVQSFIYEKDDIYERQKKELNLRLNSIEEIPHESPWYNFAKAEMIAHVAIIKLKNKDYITAAYQLRRSFKLLEENKNDYPNFIPQYKSLGFFHSAISTVPENYTWLVSIAGFNGTLSQGIRELDKVLNAAKKNHSLSYLYPEALLLRTTTALNFEKDHQKAVQLVNGIDPVFAGPLKQFITVSAYMSNGKHSDEELFFQSESLVNKTGDQLYYLYYMRGTMYINKMNLLDAENDFKKYVNSFQGLSFIKSAYQKLAWINLLQNDTTEYQKYIDLVDKNGSLFTDEDKQSQKEYESGVIPNVYLLRSRIYFDGGRYLESLSSVTGRPMSDFPSTKDQVELTYRIARINEESGRTEQALKYYDKTISIGEDLSYYFAANSALHSAYIYESQGLNEKAELYFKKCLKMRGHDYQNSIDQKAKSGLERIRTDKSK
jgi:tetratricopeptide (TPR) repeat protein